MPMLQYTPVSGKVEIELPASKSHSNRLLILQALSDCTISLNHLSEARDTLILSRLLDKIRSYSGAQLALNCMDAGTVFRFLMAYCAITPGSFLLFGTERLMERPIDELVEALKSLGALIEKKVEGWHIQGKSLEGGTIAFSNLKSSQFVSALLLIAPKMKKGLSLEWKGEKNSWPYVSMTLQCLIEFGVSWKQEGDVIRIEQGLKPKPVYEVERDWSSAAFFFPFLAKRSDLVLSFPGLSLNSMQGDAFIEVLFRYEGMHARETQFGLNVHWEKPEWRLNELSVNLSSYPDLAPLLVVYYLLQSRNVSFTGLESLALKESVRDEVLSRAVEACGGEFKKTGDHWQLKTASLLESGKLNTQADHRMAMAFSLLALHQGNIELTEMDSVEKSFPDFWKEIAKLGLKRS